MLQGLEFYRGAPIIYSLGNFVADDVYFSDGDAIRWNRTERTGCILLAELSESAVANVRQVPTFDTGRLVELDLRRLWIAAHREGESGDRPRRVAGTLPPGASLG